MKKLLLMLVLMGITSAQAQTPVKTLNSGRPTVNASTTIAVTNTFQEVFAADTGRQACAIQNNGTNAMYVFFGAIGSATKAKSLVLAAGQVMYCNVNGIIITDAVNITGTATDQFYAVRQ